MTRKYSVDEIDRMRTTIEWLHQPTWPYRPTDEAARQEGLLRTYMLNGTEPEELEDALRRKREAERPASPKESDQ